MARPGPKTGSARARHRADAAIGRIEAASGLDNASHQIETLLLARPTQLLGRPAQRVRDALHGVGYGHPLHPLLVTIPIGTWTLAAALDLLAMAGAVSAKPAERTAATALKAGALGAVVAAAAGLVDWQFLNGRDRRVGLVHGLVNGAALAFAVRSVQLRGRERVGDGRLASLFGWATMFVGGYLGGHLVYRRGVGVDHADRSPEPRDFAPVLAEADLHESLPKRVEVWDEQSRQHIGVVLVRHLGRIHAMGARCSHMGGPLDQGWMLGGALVCPWHGSRFNLETGCPNSGPATAPQPRYTTRVRDGVIELCREQEPGEPVRTSATPPKPAPDEPARKPASPRVTDVLREHHAILRCLFERIEAMPRHDRGRRDLLRMLASELEIHEHVEDAIFYPAVDPVSEDVGIAHSEHRQLSDLLAMTLKLDTRSRGFEEHLRALHAAVDRHAGSEERSMFVEAERLGDGRLRELGGEVDALMRDMRSSRFRSRFRELKISLLEGRG